MTDALSQPSAGGSAEPSGRIVVIGVGHRDHADDGIGIAVVEALHLRDERIVAIVREGDLAVLPLLWNDDDDVVIIDASRTGAPVGTVHEIDVTHLVDGDGLSTHGFSVKDAVTLADRLGRMPRRLRVVGIEGAEFGPGRLSTELWRQIPDIVDAVAAIIASGGDADRR